MVQSYCHCFSNQEEIDHGVATQKSYLAYAVLNGNKGAVEFSFRTSYVDNPSQSTKTKFYHVSDAFEDDQTTPKKVRIHSKSPLAQDNQQPEEKPFLRNTDLYYSYTINLPLHKFRCLHDNADDYHRTISSKELFDEMKAIYANIFKVDVSEVGGDDFSVLID
ncbi:hypothetical protein [Halobacillus litoralis]|uniref:Uncharacterized protein n=1 Tax=Halobacillus litoralis TaxID=45668 RepID=A0A410MA23_9BACI|nr:hypothetical protein [Halobacillus litoralis]QAS51581.1 hypothetical protein HLI_04740 [Halobacillus litoralis]